jgi:hypothetical protein
LLATIRIDDRGRPVALGRLDRRTYSLAWVEQGDPVDMTMTTPEDDGLPVLSAEDTPDRIEQALKSVLVGRTRAEVVSSLTEMGARGAYGIRPQGYGAGRGRGGR